MAELLFWPALFAYGEAAVAYGADVRHPGRAGRLATWGVRIGWLAQTALLAAQAARAEGFFFAMPAYLPRRAPRRCSGERRAAPRSSFVAPRL